eukprot:2676588-Ditylum_brightwellii.AAC.1
MPYIFLAQTNGGPDHNLTFLWSKLAAAGLFFLGNTDCLIMIRGCLQISYLNTVEQSMAILNIGLT